MRTIKKAINDIEIFDKFAESANGMLSSEWNRSADDTWTEQTTELLSDYVADLLDRSP